MVWGPVALAVVLGYLLLDGAREVGATVRALAWIGWRVGSTSVLWVADALWLGDPIRVLSWGSVDLYRRWRTGVKARLYGLYVVVGLYGSGKTAWVVHELAGLRRRYGGNVRIYTNFGWSGEDGVLHDWRQMVEAMEAKVPHVFAWDELGSSYDQHDHGEKFPRALFRLVTQMRKGPGIRIYCTVQRFSNASIDLRRLAQFIVEVRSWIGARWVWYKLFEGYEEYNEGLPRYAPGGVRDMRKVFARGRFVFSDDLRAQYDSFRVIGALKEMSDERMHQLAEREAEERANFQSHYERVRAEQGERVPAGSGRPSIFRRRVA